MRKVFPCRDIIMCHDKFNPNTNYLPLVFDTYMIGILTIKELISKPWYELADYIMNWSLVIPCLGYINVILPKGPYLPCLHMAGRALLAGYHRHACWTNSFRLGHDEVIKWKHFPRYWPFVWGIHRSPVNSPHKWPVTQTFDVFFDLRLNRRLSKQWWSWWFEMLLHPLWRHCNVLHTSNNELFNTTPLPRPMLIYCQWDPNEGTSVTLDSK